jgi:hypothetical protein
MRLSALTVVLAVAATGCYESRIARSAKQAADTNLVASRLEASELRAAEHAAKSLRQDLSGRAQTLSTVERDLRRLRLALVASWRGDPAVLQSKLKTGHLPADLVAALQEAQTTAGDSANEQRFARSVGEGKLDDAASILSGWEERVGFTPQAEDEPEWTEVEQKKPASECRRPSLTTKCRNLETEEPTPVARFVCPHPDGSKDQVVAVEAGYLALRDARPSTFAGAKILRSFKRDAWLARRELDKPVSMSTLSGKEAESRVWYSFYRLTDGHIENTLNADVPEAGQAPVLVDLDNDGFEELVTFGAQPWVAHYDPLSADVRAWSPEAFCTMPGTAKLGALAKACAEVQRKEEARMAAATALASAIAKATSPVSSVERFLKALSGCDLVTAKTLLSASVLAKIAEKLADDKQNESDAWQDFCKSFAAETSNKGAIGATAGEIKENRATVELKGSWGSDEVSLIFEGGQWKLTQRSDRIDQTYWASPIR